VQVSRKKVLIFDAAHLRKTYDGTCLDELVYGDIIGPVERTRWENCKKT